MSVAESPATCCWRFQFGEISSGCICWLPARKICSAPAAILACYFLLLMVMSFSVVESFFSGSLPGGMLFF